MKEKNDIKKNFLWNIIGVTLYGIVSLFLLVIVKRINGLETSGVFSYTYSLCTLFFYISLYYSRTYQIANYNNNKKFNDFLSFRFISSLISIVLLIVFSIISRFNIETIILLILLMIFRSIDAISDTFYGYLQEKNQLYKVGISYTLKSFISTILFLIIDILTKNIYVSIVSMIIINLVFLLLYDLRNFKLINNDNIKIQFNNFILIIKESFPIFIFSFLSIFLANAQKYVIVYYTTDDMQSIFGMIVMPATVLSLVGNYLINPFINKFKQLNNNKEYNLFNKLFLKIIISLFVIGLIGTIICYFIGILFLNIIYNIDLNIYRLDLIIIIIASIFNASCMIISNILIILNKNNLQIVFYLISSIIAVISCIILIGNNVINGATYSYLISYIINFMLYLCYYKYILKKLENGDIK